ncbi:HAMP domain-containing protein [Streptomyces tricolor]|nr:HAMP domain-containing protein [Streptomyces tricolor]
MLITTGLSIVAVHTKTELRFITVFSMIATLLITQFVAHSLTMPLDEMNTVARSISRGDYTRRVRENRRDELGDLAQTINVMADELEAQDNQRKELVANVSHELRTPIAGLRAVLRRTSSTGSPRPTRRPCGRPWKQTERLGRLVETLLDLSRLDQRRRPAEAAPVRGAAVPSRACWREANMVASARAGIASGSGSHTRTDVHLHLDVSPPELTAHADPSGSTRSSRT